MRVVQPQLAARAVDRDTGVVDGGDRTGWTGEVGFPGRALRTKEHQEMPESGRSVGQDLRRAVEHPEWPDIDICGEQGRTVARQSDLGAKFLRDVIGGPGNMQAQSGLDWIAG